VAGISTHKKHAILVDQLSYVWNVHHHHHHSVQNVKMDISSTMIDAWNAILHVHYVMEEKSQNVINVSMGIIS